ncbi:MAG: hypothetical protein O2857_30890, partial [Planctomycetota bacterium]|nr:hypothetical protein [Planctomycetota bacterium]
SNSDILPKYSLEDLLETMSSNPIELTGTIHGNSIDLDGSHDLTEGQHVRIRILSKDTPSKPDRTSGEGIRVSAGGWADGGAELENWLDALQASRKQERSQQ